jgi:TolB-like protein/class 3 adenylate cyclase
LTAERVERRLAAVLAADVAGYSRLMGTDEEGTLARLKAVRKVLVDPTIAKHRGRIVKTTGDGMLVEFASAVDAVRGAVEVQRGMADQNASVPQDQRIEFRIGIHVGDIIIDDNDIFGDGVNIAARLEGIAQPGSICISSAAYDQVRGKVAVEFVDIGEHNLKNISRSIRAYAVVNEQHAEMADTGARPRSAEASPLSIVVLPFSNMGGDPEQGHFTDGVTESLTTDLSRIPSSIVIARNTAFMYKDKAVDVKQIGRELNVRYVLEGSVQRGGSRLRLNVQLIDAETAKHLWAERFDKPVADIFDMQDEIVSRLANALEIQLVAAEALRSERKQNPNSMDLYFQGRAHLNNRTTPQAIAKARQCFERALAADPENVEALVFRAGVDCIVGAAIMGVDSVPYFAAAEAACTQVLAKVPKHAFAHLVLGSVYIFTGRAKQGVAECERALALNHNLASAHAFIGFAKQLLGRPEETEAHVLEALRISPHDVFAFWWMNWVGQSKLQLEDYPAAANWFRKAIEDNRNYAWPHLGLASALVRLGAPEEAEAAMREALALDPNFNIRLLRTKLPPIDPTLQDRRQRYLDSLSAAGMPEG